jgi:hypothetical protein
MEEKVMMLSDYICLLSHVVLKWFVIIYLESIGFVSVVEERTQDVEKESKTLCDCTFYFYMWFSCA